MYDRYDIARVLVIAPKKVAEVTWQAEIGKWSHLRHLRTSTVMGTEKQRIAAVCSPADVYIINRDNVVWLVDYLRNDWNFDMVVIDEASSFKSHSSKRFKAMRLVAPRLSRIVELTGTPSPKSLIDLWAQVFLLDGGERLGRTISAYRERYFLPDKRSGMQIFSYKPKDDTPETVKELLSDICVSMSAKDYLSLPDRIDVTVPVMLDAKAKKAYDRLERDMLLEVDEDLITAQSAAVLRMKLLQLCNGAAYDGDGRPVTVHDCKLEAFLELVEGLHGDPALVFYAFRHDRDRILAALAKTGLRVREYNSAKDGEDWNVGLIDVMLAHPASCAYGLNLQQGGHNVVWYGLTDNLELYQQAVARLHRQGQEKPVVVHHLVTVGGVDVDVMNGLSSKAQMQDELLENLKARIRRARIVSNLEDM
jgi:SNF2 family DNA or RNA helicase